MDSDDSSPAELGIRKRGATPDPTACPSDRGKNKKTMRTKKNGGHVTWRWSRLRGTGTIRRKRRPSSDGLGQVHDRKSEASESGDSSREKINLIVSQEIITGSSFEQASSSPSSSSQIRHGSCGLSGRVQESHGHGRPHRCRGLSHEYQPKAFEEIIGHEMIIKALSNSIRRKRISPLYLFHGPGGTGKTSAARIFAMALNCDSAADSPALKPCWGCWGCSQSLYTAELCSGNRSSGFEKIRTFLQSTEFTQKTSSGFKVFIIDNLAAESWPWAEVQNIIIQEQEDASTCGSMVFILITEDASTVPRAVSSRCQKFSFSKLKDTDVILKLSRIVAREGIEIRKDALKLIARKAVGNLREAENLLDQLALLELRITASMVQRLVGLVPHNRLICLLEAALSGSSIEAVTYTWDLIRLGIEPRALVSQLGALVTEFLAGTCSWSSPALQDQIPIRGHSLLRNKQPERLNQALKVLIETEKQLMMSPCNHTTWITAAVLQIALAGCSHHISPSIPLLDDTEPAERIAARHVVPQQRNSCCGAIDPDNKSDTPNKLDSKDIDGIGLLDYIEGRETNHHQFTNSAAEHHTHNTANLNTSIKSIDMEEVWHGILERIQNKSLAEFLQCQAKLVSLTVSRANAIVHLTFKHSEQITVESIANTLKAALGLPVTVNISRESTQLQVVTRNCFTHKDKQVPEPSCSKQHKTQVLGIPKPPGSLDGRGLLKPSVSRESAPILVSNLRSTKFPNSTQMFVQRTGNAVSMAQSQQNPILSGHLTHGGKDGTSTDPEMGDSGRDQCLDFTSIARATEHRLVSISSIPQTDASIEPYSQDLLFEEANSDRQQGTRKSKLYKELLKQKQHRHNMTYINRGLNRSWSCTERFGRSKNMVNEDTMGLATNRHVLKLVYPCKDSTIINSIINKAQPDLRKTVPTSPSFLLQHNPGGAAPTRRRKHARSP